MKNKYIKKFLIVLKYLAIYFLATKLICFAIPKFLFMQFRVLHYEAYAPLIEISKTQHMWSFFGRSYHYNLFIGLAEFLIGVFIVFKRTRLIALLMALGLYSNLLVLNTEFDINFAIGHTIFDFTLVLLLLADYYQDIYTFFIQLGGRINKPLTFEKNKVKRYFPAFFIVILSVSYFIFALNLKSTVNDEVIGSYKIEGLTIDNTTVELSNGKIGKDPMLFIEHNNQIVFSINDSLYFGNYALEKDSIRIGFYQQPTEFQIRTIFGIIKNNTISGESYDKHSIQLNYTRIDSKKNYLNGLYSNFHK